MATAEESPSRDVLGGEWLSLPEEVPREMECIRATLQSQDLSADPGDPRRGHGLFAEARSQSLEAPLNLKKPHEEPTYAMDDDYVREHRRDGRISESSRPPGSQHVYREPRLFKSQYAIDSETEASSASEPSRSQKKRIKRASKERRISMGGLIGDGCPDATLGSPREDGRQFTAGEGMGSSALKTGGKPPRGLTYRSFNGDSSDSSVSGPGKPTRDKAYPGYELLDTRTDEGKLQQSRRQLRLLQSQLHPQDIPYQKSYSRSRDERRDRKREFQPGQPPIVQASPRPDSGSQLRNPVSDKLKDAMHGDVKKKVRKSLRDAREQRLPKRERPSHSPPPSDSSSSESSDSDGASSSKYSEDDDGTSSLSDDSAVSEGSSRRRVSRKRSRSGDRALSTKEKFKKCEARIRELKVANHRKRRSDEMSR